MKPRLLITLACGALSCAAPFLHAQITLSHAVPIPGLFGTGLDAVGNILPDGATDPHYSLIAVPSNSGLGPDAFVVDSSKRPISTGDWISNDSKSKWIAPVADQSNFLETTGVTGQYVYRLIFDLSGYDAASARIDGMWSTDNPGEDILLNGVSTGFTHTDGAQGSSFTYFDVFTISTGFAAGINTLDFIIYNTPFPPGSPSAGGSNPSGLRIELSSAVETIPEPSVTTCAMLGTLLLSRLRSHGCRGQQFSTYRGPAKL